MIKDGSIILESNSDHIIEFDAGELTTGFLDFRFSGGENAQLEIMTAESYVYHDCHAWGSLALYEIPSVILGVSPAKPGYAEVLMKLIPGYLRSAKGSIMTPHGQILVAWKNKGNGIKVDIQAPLLNEDLISTIYLTYKILLY